MANYCINRMWVSGSVENIRRFVQKYISDKYAGLDALLAAKFEGGYYVCIDGVEISDEYVIIELSTRVAPPCEAFKELAVQWPELRFRAGVIEPGNEFAYLFTAENGAFEEGEVEFTEEFFEEVTGEKLEIDPIYFQRAELEKTPLTHFFYWGDKARILRAIRGYPVFDPPHRGIEMAMPEAQARENFDYFMSEKPRRLEYVKTLLARFGVQLDFSEECKRGLDRWIWKYSAFLDVVETPPSYLTYNPRWDGVRVGLNVMFDLGVLLGEWAIRESPFLYWEMLTDIPSGSRKSDDSFQKPVIGGVKVSPRWRLYPMDEVYRMCGTLRHYSYFWKNPRIILPPKKESKRYATNKLKYWRFIAEGDLESTWKLN